MTIRPFMSVPVSIWKVTTPTYRLPHHSVNAMAMRPLTCSNCLQSSTCGLVKDQVSTELITLARLHRNYGSGLGGLWATIGYQHLSAQNRASVTMQQWDLSPIRRLKWGSAVGIDGVDRSGRLPLYNPDYSLYGSIFWV